MPRPRALPAVLLTLVVAALLALPAAAPAAEVHTFVNTTDLFPSGDANATVGPANAYPSAIEVEGVEGTVTKVTAEVVDLGSARPEDIDLALENPEGEVTMLMSDACGGETHNLANDDWTFSDDAPGFLSQLGCTSSQTAGYKPSNYGNPSADDLSVGEGPEGPYVNTLAALAGGEPEGEWGLYALDDAGGVVGFEISAWVLRLEVEPPPASPAPIVPAPVVGLAPPAATQPAVATPAAPAAPASSARTGRRARALARCKTKKTDKARRACKRQARKLPL